MRPSGLAPPLTHLSPLPRCHPAQSAAPRPRPGRHRESPGGRIRAEVRGEVGLASRLRVPAAGRVVATPFPRMSMSMSRAGRIGQCTSHTRAGAGPGGSEGPEGPEGRQHGRQPAPLPFPLRINKALGSAPRGTAAPSFAPALALASPRQSLRWSTLANQLPLLIRPLSDWAGCGAGWMAGWGVAQRSPVTSSSSPVRRGVQLPHVGPHCGAVRSRMPPTPSPLPLAPPRESPHREEKQRGALGSAALAGRKS